MTPGDWKKFTAICASIKLKKKVNGEEHFSWIHFDKMAFWYDGWMRTYTYRLHYKLNLLPLDIVFRSLYVQDNGVQNFYIFKKLVFFRENLNVLAKRFTGASRKKKFFHLLMSFVILLNNFPSSSFSLDSQWN